MRSFRPLIGVGITIGVISSAAVVFAQRPEDAGESRQDPPSFVLEAWESGEAPVPPQTGPPTWVVDAWKSGEHPRASGEFGPPAFVVERHRMAQELGLPGPPPEIIGAWENGEGFDLS